MRPLGTIVVPATGDSNSRACILDLSTKTTHVNTVVQTAPIAGLLYTLAFVGDSGAGVTITVDTTAKTIVVHFNPGVSTVANLETAINALAGGNKVLQVRTAGTGGNVLAATVDEFAALSLGTPNMSILPDSYRSVYMESDTDGLFFSDGAGDTLVATAAAGHRMYNGKDANTAQGPYAVRRLGQAAVTYAVNNPTGAAANVRMWGE